MFFSFTGNYTILEYRSSSNETNVSGKLHHNQLMLSETIHSPQIEESLFPPCSFPGGQRCGDRGPYRHPGCPGHRPGCSRVALLGCEKEETDWRDVQTQRWRTDRHRLHCSTRRPEVTKGGKTHLTLAFEQILFGHLGGSRVKLRSPLQGHAQLVSWHALHITYETLLRKAPGSLDAAGLEHFFCTSIWATLFLVYRGFLFTVLLHLLDLVFYESVSPAKMIFYLLISLQQSCSSVQ